MFNMQIDTSTFPRSTYQRVTLYTRPEFHGQEGAFHKAKNLLVVSSHCHRFLGYSGTLQLPKNTLMFKCIYGKYYLGLAKSTLIQWMVSDALYKESTYRLKWMLIMPAHTAKSFHAPSVSASSSLFQCKDWKSDTFQSDMTKWSPKVFLILKVTIRNMDL